MLAFSDVIAHVKTCTCHFACFYWAW